MKLLVQIYSLCLEKHLTKVTDDAAVDNAVGLAPGAHDPDIIVGDEQDLIDAVRAQFSSPANVC